MGAAREALPRLTIAVLHHHLRGYPIDCLESLGAADSSREREFLLLEGHGATAAAAVRAKFPHVRIIPVEHSDRSVAKNLAVTEARGKFILFVTADTLAVNGAEAKLLKFLESQRCPAVTSAQLLLENGMRRRTTFEFPALLHEINPFRWLWHKRYLFAGKGRVPLSAGTLKAAGLHATFLMARRDVFEKIGLFTEGYRFGYEDLEWCWRASRAGIGRFVLLDARAYKMPPQLRGDLSTAIHASMESSLRMMVFHTRSSLYAATFRNIRRAKEIFSLGFAEALNTLLFKRSSFFKLMANANRRMLQLPAEFHTEALPPEIESHVRWEWKV